MEITMQNLLFGIAALIAMLVAADVSGFMSGICKALLVAFGIV